VTICNQFQKEDRDTQRHRSRELQLAIGHFLLVVFWKQTKHIIKQIKHLYLYGLAISALKLLAIATCTNLYCMKLMAVRLQT